MVVSPQVVSTTLTAWMPWLSLLLACIDRLAEVTDPDRPDMVNFKYAWTSGEPSARKVVPVPLFTVGLAESTYASALGRKVVDPPPVEVEVGVLVKRGVLVGVNVLVGVLVGPVGVNVLVNTPVAVAVLVLVEVLVAVGVEVAPPALWQLLVPESVKVLPVSWTNCQS